MKCSLFLPPSFLLEVFGQPLSWGRLMHSHFGLRVLRDLINSDGPLDIDVNRNISSVSELEGN